MPCELMLLLNLPIVWNKTGKKKVTGCDKVNLAVVWVLYWPFMTSQEASTHSEWMEQAKKNWLLFFPENFDKVIAFFHQEGPF